ncbi:MAG: hypothetical protein D6679_13855, partial [Candidatus Hydrogenedentota bacterium]
MARLLLAMRRVFFLLFPLLLALLAGSSPITADSTTNTVSSTGVHPIYREIRLHNQNRSSVTARLKFSTGAVRTVLLPPQSRRRVTLPDVSWVQVEIQSDQSVAYATRMKEKETEQ